MGTSPSSVMVKFWKFSGESAEGSVRVGGEGGEGGDVVP